MKTTRVRMNVSIAGTVEGRDFSAQPDDIIDLPANVAKKWIAVRHASPVAPGTPLSERDTDLRDLSAEEALHYRCAACDERRAETVIANKPYCLNCSRGVLGG